MHPVGLQTANREEEEEASGATCLGGSWTRFVPGTFAFTPHRYHARAHRNQSKTTMKWTLESSVAVPLVRNQARKSCPNVVRPSLE